MNAYQKWPIGLRCSGGWPWVQNCISGIAHRAVLDCDDAAHFAIACRPNATLHTGYVLRQEDPTQFGFQACQHAGCVNFTGNDVEP